MVHFQVSKDISCLKRLFSLFHISGPLIRSSEIILVKLKFVGKHKLSNLS